MRLLVELLTRLKRKNKFGLYNLITYICSVKQLKLYVMGRYVNFTSKGDMGSSAWDKRNALIEDGAIQIETPTEFKENLVCVVDNGFFGAAGYAFCENEFHVFNDPRDMRPKTWFIWDKVEKYAN